MHSSNSHDARELTVLKSGEVKTVVVHPTIDKRYGTRMERRAPAVRDPT
jgi:hypothetical protein